MNLNIRTSSRHLRPSRCFSSVLGLCIRRCGYPANAETRDAATRLGEPAPPAPSLTDGAPPTRRCAGTESGEHASLALFNALLDGDAGPMLGGVRFRPLRARGADPRMARGRQVAITFDKTADMSRCACLMPLASPPSLLGSNGEPEEEEGERIIGSP